jgi:hypothetical protein
VKNKRRRPRFWALVHIEHYILIAVIPLWIAALFYSTNFMGFRFFKQITDKPRGVGCRSPPILLSHVNSRKGGEVCEFQKLD